MNREPFSFSPPRSSRPICRRKLGPSQRTAGACRRRSHGGRPRPNRDDRGPTPQTLLPTERTPNPPAGSDIHASVLKSGDRIFVQGVRLRSGPIEAREIRIGDQNERVPLGDTPTSGGHKH